MKRQRNEAQEEGVGVNQMEGGKESGGRGCSCMLRNERDSSITVSWGSAVMACNNKLETAL